MNKGIITKAIVSDGKVKYNIRLDRNVKIPEKTDNETEYNIYIDSENKKSYLIETSHKCSFGSDNFNGIIMNLGCKYEFKLNFNEYEKDRKNDILIEELAYEG